MSPPLFGLLIIILALPLAVAGALVAEWTRLRLRWLPMVAPAYATAAGCAASIVVANGVLHALVGPVDGRSTSFTHVSDLLPDLLVVLVVGPALHGITWILVLHAWQCVQSLIAGSKSPWQ